jgi:hypothetical protein
LSRGAAKRLQPPALRAATEPERSAAEVDAAALNHSDLTIRWQAAQALNMNP